MDNNDITWSHLAPGEMLCDQVVEGLEVGGVEE